jgi:hypothetical protein
MQTFLTDRDWSVTAKQLDYQRLGKQRVECKQLLAAMGWEVNLEGRLARREASKGWVNHPVTRMWLGYEVALAEYQRVMIMEWISRGYTNTMAYIDPARVFQLPPWIDDERVYASHRSNLLRKLPHHYEQFGWTEGPDLPYFYPEGQKA